MFNGRGPITDGRLRKAPVDRMAVGGGSRDLSPGGGGENPDKRGIERECPVSEVLSVVPDLGADPTGVFRGTMDVNRKKKKTEKKQINNRRP